MLFYSQSAKPAVIFFILINPCVTVLSMLLLTKAEVSDESLRDLPELDQ